MAEPEIRYCTTADGASIAYYTMGEGLPLVVTSSVIWSDLRVQWAFREYHSSRRGRGLGRGLQIVRYDARGTGLSARDTLDFSMEARLRDIDAVVERLKLERFALFGSVHGAPAAIAYAAAHPERVSHLIIGSGFANGRVYRETMADAAMTALARGTLMHDEEWERYTLNTANWAIEFLDAAFARVVAEGMRASMTPESLHAYVAANDGIDVTALLPSVAVRTLVMYRHRSYNVSQPEWSRELASKIPDARFVEIAKRASPAWTNEETRIVEEFLGVDHEARTPAAAPGRAASAARTILFTDIVGHTEMMQRLGDARGREVLRDHERITREALAAHGGVEVKTDGDSFMATFASTSSAVECAIALQRALAAWPSPERGALTPGSSPTEGRGGSAAGERIVVRMGLNVGEPIEEDGDFFGSAVILGARIKDQAGGGEILVPEAVRHMLAGKGFVFSDRGEVVLKGFEEGVRLFEVRWRE